jgi:hypothetical protein
VTEPPTPPPSGSDDELDQDERAELLRLREEAAGRRAAEPSQERLARRRRPGWRPIVASLLIILGCVLAPLSVLAVWAKTTVTNTDRYVATVEPLASDPAVQSALANRITNVIFSYIDVEALVDQAVDALEAQGLPATIATQLRGLGGSIEDGARNFVHDRALAVVTSDAFQQAWVDANRVAHQDLVALLEGEGNGAVTVEGDAVRVDLAAFIDVVKQNLVNAGFTIVERVPEVHPEFTILQSSDLVKAQTGFRALDRLGTWLPFVALGLLGLGVYVAPRHRRALVWAGAGVGISMLVLAVVLALVRNLYLDGLPETVSAPAAAAVFDALVRFLRAGLRTVFVLGLVVAGAAFLTGPSTTAVRVRAAVSGSIRRLRRLSETAGLRTGPVGAWVYRNRGMLRAGVVGVAVLAFVFWDRPTGKVVLLLTLLLLVALAIIEFLARPPKPGEEPPSGPPGAPAPV